MNYLQLPCGAYRDNAIWNWVVDHSTEVDWYGFEILGFDNEELFTVFRLKFGL